MANSFLTIDMVTKEAMRLAHEKATFIGTIDRQYDDSFAKTGAKIGSSLRVRQPNEYSVRTGRVADVQDQDERSQTITLATQVGVDMSFTGAEMALDIDEFSTRYLAPAMSRLVSKVDSDCIVQATKDTYNVVGSAGTVVGTVTSGFSDTSALGLARARLNEGLAPKDSNRSLQMDSVTMAYVANGVKGLFLPTGQIETAFREGFIAHTAMCDLYENERTWTLSNTDDVTANTNADAAVTDAASSSTNGLSIACGDDLAQAKQTVGSVFTVAGVYACHPETKQAYSHLQQFVVTATGATAVSVLPQIFLTGPRQNVCSSSGAQLATTDFNEQAMTFIGSASTSYRQNLMYHSNAFAFVSADLPLHGGADTCSRMTQDGISLRVWRDGDVVNDMEIMRIDLLYGFKTLRPAWSCRITN